MSSKQRLGTKWTDSVFTTPLSQKAHDNQLKYGVCIYIIWEKLNSLEKSLWTRDASTNKVTSFEYKGIFTVIAYASSCRRCRLTLYSLAQPNLEILKPSWLLGAFETAGIWKDHLCIGCRKQAGYSTKAEKCCLSLASPWLAGVKTLTPSTAMTSSSTLHFSWTYKGRKKQNEQRKYPPNVGNEASGPTTVSGGD